MSIASNLERLQNEIADACASAHRKPETVALMAVSKIHPVESMIEAYEAGQRLFGENRVQEWQAKSVALDKHFAPSSPSEKGLKVHLIGPLQNNKVSKAADLFDAVDTLDSIKTAERLSAAAGAIGKRLPVLVEVKLSHEESKHGVAADQLMPLLEASSRLPHLEIRGLMTVPPFDEDPEVARPYFRQLRQLRDEHLHICPTLKDLSMGMSNDFVVAIQEGSTAVRLGTAIFGKRIYT